MDARIEARLTAMAVHAQINEKVLLGIVREVEQMVHLQIADWLEASSEVVPDREYALEWAAKELRRKVVS